MWVCAVKLKKIKVQTKCTFAHDAPATTIVNEIKQFFFSSNRILLLLSLSLATNSAKVTNSRISKYSITLIKEPNSMWSRMRLSMLLSQTYKLPVPEWTDIHDILCAFLCYPNPCVVKSSFEWCHQHHHSHFRSRSRSHQQSASSPSFLLNK